MSVSVFRRRWGRIGLADPLLHKRIHGWVWIVGHVWWKSKIEPSKK